MKMGSRFATHPLRGMPESPTSLSSARVLRQADILAHVTDTLLCASELEPIAPAIEQLHGAARRLYRCAYCQEANDAESSKDYREALSTIGSSYGRVRRRLSQCAPLDWRTTIAWRDVEDCCQCLAPNGESGGALDIGPDTKNP